MLGYSFIMGILNQQILKFKKFAIDPGWLILEKLYPALASLKTKHSEGYKNFAGPTHHISR